MENGLELLDSLDDGRHTPLRSERHLRRPLQQAPDELPLPGHRPRRHPRLELRKDQAHGESPTSPHGTPQHPAQKGLAAAHHRPVSTLHHLNHRPSHLPDRRNHHPELALDAAEQGFHGTTHANLRHRHLSSDRTTLTRLLPNLHCARRQSPDRDGNPGHGRD